MADDAALERFLADAAPLRAGGGYHAARAFALLAAAGFEGDAELAGPIAEALRVSAVATEAPSDRNTAIALYALERAAIVAEGRLPTASVEEPAFRGGRR